MTDAPEIDLRWIGTQLLAMQNDMRAVRNDIRILKEDFTVTAEILRWLDTKQDILLDELRALYPANQPDAYPHR